MEILEVGRVVERLMVTIFAGVSIVLGWHLFKIGVVMPGNLEWKESERTLKLMKVGPGVFFALFGTVVLSLALSFGLEFKTAQGREDYLYCGSNSKAPGDEGKTNLYYRYFSGTADSEGQRLEAVLALNTVLNSITDEKVNSGNVPPDDLLAVVKASQPLRSLRESLLEAQFGQLDLQLWTAKGDAYIRNKSSCSKSEGNRLEEMRPWMTWDIETPRP